MDNTGNTTTVSSGSFTWYNPPYWIYPQWNYCPCCGKPYGVQPQYPQDPQWSYTSGSTAIGGMQSNAKT